MASLKLLTALTVICLVCCTVSAAREEPANAKPTEVKLPAAQPDQETEGGSYGYLHGLHGGGWNPEETEGGYGHGGHGGAWTLQVEETDELVDDLQLPSADEDELVGEEYYSNVLKVGKITPASKKEQAEIRSLVNMWDHDTLDKNLRQGTWYKYTGSKIQWRLDNQKNGAVNIDGIFYYVLAVQTGKDVYSNVQVPYLFYLGRQRIRDAFMKSMTDLATIRIILPDKAHTQPPAQTDPNARKPNVAQLQWQMVKV